MIEIDEILKRNMQPDYIPADDLNAKILESAVSILTTYYLCDNLVSKTR